MIKIRELDHIVLRTANCDALLQFYCDVLGCRIEKRQEAYGLIQLRAGTSMLDLITVDGVLGKMGGAAPGSDGLNLDHFCFRIDPFDESAIRDHLNTHGIECAPAELRSGAEGIGPSLYVKDPDGNTVELRGPPQLG